MKALRKRKESDMSHKSKERLCGKYLSVQGRVRRNMESTEWREFTLAWIRLLGENINKREEREHSQGHSNFRGLLKQKE